MRILAQVLVPLAGFAVFSGPVCSGPVFSVPAAAGFAPAGFAPAGTQCAGGLCDVCPAVATALTAADAQIYCVA
jgi:hypothetical protein